MGEDRPTSATCIWCLDVFPVAPMGPKTPQYCKPSHRQRAYEARHNTSFYDDVKAFHVLFNLPVGDKPAFTDHDDQLLRVRLIDEEFAELRLAHISQDLVEVADACADIIYVVCGMAVSYGIPLNEVFAEVQRTNMAKVGADGKPKYRADGKVNKPDDWQPPDIRRILYGEVD